jgi:hypothetical protein
MGIHAPITIAGIGVVNVGVIAGAGSGNAA